MNSYERYMAVLDGETPDVVPRLPILMQFAAEFIGSNYGAFASDYRVLVEANLRCIEHFGFDQVSAISDPFRETQGFGAPIQYVSDGVPRCPEPPLEHDRDFAKLPTPAPHSSERMLDRVRAVEAFKASCHRERSILGWVEGPAAEAADLRTPTHFLMDLVLDPGYAAELMDLCVDVGIAFGRAQFDAGADTMGVGDAIASQVSAGVYRETIFPREQRLFDALHEAGGLIRLHICGDITHLLPHVAELHADIIDLDWQVDMAQAREILGPQRVLCGNIDPAQAILRGTPEGIRSAIRGIYETVGAPYMAGAGCEIPSGTPPDNLAALCEPIPAT